MTANQINYQKVVEERRKNRAQEAETARHNRQDEANRAAAVGASLAVVDESRRHNQEQELINWYTTQWQGARAGDQTTLDSASVQTAIQNAVLRESELAAQIAHNAAMEEEATRHNQEMEAVQRGQLGVSQQDANTRSIRIFTDLAGSLLNSLTR